MNKTIAIFAGAGVGALLGLLIGMSVSNTVGVVIGSIASILVILLGVNDKENAVPNALRVGSFGAFCTIFSLLGLYIRSNDVFSPSISDQIGKWTDDSLFTKTEAKQYVVYERLGIISPGIHIDSNRVNSPLASVFYSKEASQEVCDKLDAYKDYTVTEELRAYKIEGGVWAALADSMTASIPIEQQKAILHLVKNCLCDAK